MAGGAFGHVGHTRKRSKLRSTPVVEPSLLGWGCLLGVRTCWAARKAEQAPLYAGLWSRACSAGMPGRSHFWTAGKAEQVPLYGPSRGRRMSVSRQRRPWRVNTQTTGRPFSSWMVAVKRERDSKRCSASFSGSAGTGGAWVVAPTGVADRFLPHRTALQDGADAQRRDHRIDAAADNVVRHRQRERAEQAGLELRAGATGQLVFHLRAQVDPQGGEVHVAFQSGGVLFGQRLADAVDRQVRPRGEVADKARDQQGSQGDPLLHG